MKRKQMKRKQKKRKEKKKREKKKLFNTFLSFLLLFLYLLIIVGSFRFLFVLLFIMFYIQYALNLFHCQNLNAIPDYLFKYNTIQYNRHRFIKVVIYSLII